MQTERIYKPDIECQLRAIALILDESDKYWRLRVKLRTVRVGHYSRFHRKRGLPMAALIDRMELSNDQRVELDEEGVTWIVQEPVPGVTAAQKIRLEAAAATMLFDFLLLYEEHLVCWRDGLTP